MKVQLGYGYAEDRLQECCLVSWDRGTRSAAGMAVPPQRFTHQDVLDFIIAALDVVQHHVLGYVLPVFQLIHLVVGVRVEHRPSKELCQRLGRRKMEGIRQAPSPEYLHSLRCSSTNTRRLCFWFPNYLNSALKLSNQIEVKLARLTGV